MSAAWFLDIPEAAAHDPTAPYAVLPLPYERTVTFGTGAAEGPAAVLRASHELEDFDEEFLQPVDLRVQTLPAPDLGAREDAEALACIRRAAEPPFAEGRFVLGLGGEHTISAPLVAAARAACGPLTVLQVDAHPDLRDRYQGTPWSHACAMRRVRDLGVTTVHVGARSLSRDDAEAIRDLRIPVFYARDLHVRPATEWIPEVLQHLSDRVYVSVDIDGLDPSLVPGTGTPDPGGLDWYTLLALLRAVCESRQVVGADVVEVAPIEGSQVSETVAARLALKILLYHQHAARQAQA